MSDIVHVAVAVIVDQANMVCLSLRHTDAHQGGLWEFPGGKVENNETIVQALQREIKEELDIHIISSRSLITIKHNYQDKSVCLHVYKILSYTGEATSKEGQQVKWVSIEDLPGYDFPKANAAILKSLQLPDKYLITGEFTDTNDFIQKLKRSLDVGITLVQIRLKHDSMEDEANAQSLLGQAAILCESAGARLMLNISASLNASIDFSSFNFDGFHADSQTLSKLSRRPHATLFSASCHNNDELLKAVELGADFVVLSPVQQTVSHPGMRGMGWVRFSNMIEGLTIPVYALGGVSEDDMETAWANGAQGVSAISAFWGK
ncbi:MAG: pyrophosphohydrolase [Gammaproteobacteria bacterium]|nr:MAG: pyrophosphohydrolase [Gammaproteobacteria bacterium]